MTRHRLNQRLCINAPNGYKRLLLVCGLYVWHPLTILELLEFLEVTPTPKNTSKPSKNLVIKSLVLSTSLRVLVLDLALKWVRKQDVAAMCVVLRVNQHCILVRGSKSEPTLYLGAPAPWRIGGSPESQWLSGLMWSGIDNFVREMWKPPSFVGKLLSGK